MEEKERERVRRRKEKTTITIRQKYEQEGVLKEVSQIPHLLCPAP